MSCWPTQLHIHVQYKRLLVAPDQRKDHNGRFLPLEVVNGGHTHCCPQTGFVENSFATCSKHSIANACGGLHDEHARLNVIGSKVFSLCTTQSHCASAVTTSMVNIRPQYVGDSSSRYREKWLVIAVREGTGVAHT